ncbi:MAG: hypothetical protein VKJ46_07930 [Leptolyngbyaceae bacterium]|nr:hypothetical protein [Leptolyngbyaceae bacterium]
MKNSAKEPSSHPWCFSRQCASGAILATTLLLGGYGAPGVYAVTPSVQISQNIQGWDAVLQMARLVGANQETSAYVLQMNVLNKPATSYANAVYQLFARKGDRWIQVYSSTGARLISGAAGPTRLAPEVITLEDIQSKLGRDVNWANVELQSVVQLRYDLQGGARDQILRFEQTKAYREIAQTTTTQLISSRTTALTQTSTPRMTQSQSISSSGQSAQYQGSSCRGFVQSTQTTQAISAANNTQAVNRGHFSLAILQKQQTLPYAIARVSLMAKRPKGYLRERFIGDFRYKIKNNQLQKAKFIRGLNPGDLVVVRLFDPQNNLIGYSQFELLADFAAVNLVLSDQPATNPTLRTVYGIDANQDGILDRGTQVFDYFTRTNPVTSRNFSDAVVTFLSSTHTVNLSGFTLSNLPAPQSCLYPGSLYQGNFSVVNNTLRVFSSRLASAIISPPTRVVSLIDVSSTRLSTYEVSKLAVNYKEVGVSQGIITSIRDDNDDDDDDDDDDNDDLKKRRRNCNQGIGNGSEGCDPGKSRPHGGSNDEGGRTPSSGTLRKPNR